MGIAVRLTKHQFEVYQKLRRDRLVPVRRVGEILGTSDIAAQHFIIGMKIPVYTLGVRPFRNRNYVFSSDVVKAVADAERLPTIQLSRELFTDAVDRKHTRNYRARGDGRHIQDK